MSEVTQKLGTRLKLSYSLADVGFIFMVTMSNTYLLIFFTDYAGIAAAAAGTLMMVGRIIDTISPPFIGTAIERSNPKGGKYRSWLMYGAPFIFILNIMLFVDLPLSPVLKVVVGCLLYAAFCISTNVSYTGYTSLNSALTADPKERVQLSMLRGQGNAIGKVIAGFALIPIITLLSNANGEMSKQGFTLTAVIASIFMLLLYFNLFAATKKYEAPASAQTVAKEKIKFSEMAKLVLTSRPLMTLFFADVCRILTMLVMFAMFPFFFKYSVQNMAGLPIFFGIVNILSFIGATMVPFITKKLTKRSTYLLGNIMLVISLIMASIFKGSIALVITFISIGYFGYAWGNVVNTSMYADAVDECEQRTGKSARAVFFSMYQLSIKVAAIFSTGIAGFGLALVGFQANVEPTAGVISGINFISMGLPAALMAVSAIMVFLYNINEKKLAEQIAASKKQS